MNRYIARCLSLAAIALLGACSQHSDDGAAESAVMGGTQTCTLAAVGIISPAPVSSIITGDLTSAGKCTATLIAPDVVLTAAHCFSGALEQQGKLGTFVANAGCSNASTFNVTHLRRWNDAWIEFHADDDLALAMLDKPVPSSVAKPVPIAENIPNDGDPITWYGYGQRTFLKCEVMDESTDGHKSAFHTTYPASHLRVCDADDGGPLLSGKGEIVSTVAGRLSLAAPFLTAATGGISWGDPVKHRAELLEQIAKWHTTSLGPTGASTDGGTGSRSDAGTRGDGGGATGGRGADAGMAGQATDEAGASSGGDTEGAGADGTGGAGTSGSGGSTRADAGRKSSSGSSTEGSGAQETPPTSGTSSHGGCSQSGAPGNGAGGAGVFALIIFVLGSRRERRHGFGCSLSAEDVILTFRAARGRRCRCK